MSHKILHIGQLLWENSWCLLVFALRVSQGFGHVLHAVSGGGQSQFSRQPHSFWVCLPFSARCETLSPSWAHARVSCSMGNERQMVCKWFWIYAENSWALTRTEEGTWSQTCFVPSTPFWLLAEALSSSVTQHVVCACLAVHKTSKDTLILLHISKPETLQSMLTFPYLQLNKQTNGKKKKERRNKSKWLFDF